MSLGKKKILIFIISYKASHRVRDVFKKIPFRKLKKYNIHTLISDDKSDDDTSFYIKEIKNKSKNVYTNINKKNLGYGKHIKQCLTFALKKNFDHAVMIHGDGQYDPKYIPSLLKILTKDKNIGATTGSRMLKSVKKVIKGGMPFYKLMGNIILTNFFNLLMNTNYTDTHTGLWAYNLSLLKNKKFNLLTNTFNFDQEFRVKNILEKKLIKEIPIKTKYGDERSQLHILYAIKFFFNTILYFLIKKKIIGSKKFKF